MPALLRERTGHGRVAAGERWPPAGHPRTPKAARGRWRGRPRLVASLRHSRSGRRTAVETVFEFGVFPLQPARDAIPGRVAPRLATGVRGADPRAALCATLSAGAGSASTALRALAGCDASLAEGCRAGAARPRARALALAVALHRRVPLVGTRHAKSKVEEQIDVLPGLARLPLRNRPRFRPGGGRCTTVDAPARLAAL